METTESAVRSRIPWLTRLTVQGYATHDMLKANYEGAGTEYDPYLVTFVDNDPVNPAEFSWWKRWIVCLVAGFVTFIVAFNSSAYVSAVGDLSRDFGHSIEVVTLSVGVFLIGTILGPFVWAPSSGE